MMEQIGLEAIMKEQDYIRGVTEIIRATQRMEDQHAATAKKLSALDSMREVSAREVAAAEKRFYAEMEEAARKLAQEEEEAAKRASEAQEARKNRFVNIARTLMANYYNISNMARDFYQAMVKAWDFAKEGAELDLAERKFGRLAQTMSSTGDVMLGKLKRATQGMMSDAALMQRAGDIMALGLVKTEDQAIRLTGAIAALGADMNQVVLTLSNQTTMRFDQIGIAIDGFDERLAALKATGMSTNEAFTEAFLQQAEAQVNKLGGVAETTAGQMMILEASIANVKNQAKMAVAEGLGPMIIRMNEEINANLALRTAMENNLITMEQYRAAYMAITLGIGDLDEAMAPVVSQVEKLGNLETYASLEAENWDEKNRDLHGSLQDIERDTRDLYYSTEDYAAALSDSTSAEEWYRIRAEESDKVVQVYGQHLRETQEAQEDLGGATEESAHKVGSLNTALQNQITSLKDQIQFLASGGGVLLTTITQITNAINTGTLGFEEGMMALDEVGIAAVDLDLELNKIDPDEAVKRLMELGKGPEEAEDIVNRLEDTLFNLTSKQWIIQISANIEGGVAVPTGGGDGGGGDGSGGGGVPGLEEVGGEKPISMGIGVPVFPIVSATWGELGAQLGAELGRQLDDIGSLTELMDIGGRLGGILRTFTGMYEQETVDPMRERLELQEDELEAVRETIAAKREQYFGELSEKQYIKLRKQYAIDATSLTELERNQLMEIMALENQRNALINERAKTAKELADEEARMLELQKQQQQLQFLQQQMEMLELIREYGLNPAEILGGMKLGLDASLPDLIMAMSTAMEAIINAANEELQISSPSKVMENIAHNLMDTFGSTLVSSAQMPIGAMQDVMSGISTMAMAATNAPLAYSSVTRTANITFGDTNLASGIDMAMLESMMRTVLRRELGVAS